MTVKTYFDDHFNIVESELLKASKEVLIAVAWINFKLYFNTFMSLREQGIMLKIVCSNDKINSKYHHEITILCSHGAMIKLLKMPRIKNHMHHKFTIIDKKTILSGSYNWSLNAAFNFENLIVISGHSSEVAEYIREFEKLILLETNYIKSLQRGKKCSESGCRGELLNILVFSERSKYYETYGDIVEVCNECDYYEAIKEGISDTTLDMLLEGYADSEDYDTESHWLEINKHLDQYLYQSLVIHAIGRVRSGLDFAGEDVLETSILWKNKFVGNRLPDTLEGDFGAGYDNEYYIGE